MMWQIFVSLFLCSLHFNEISSQDEFYDVLVHPPIGPVRGLSFHSPITTKQHYNFRGISYAEPPTGNLRFRQAVPVKKWNEPFNGTEASPGCPIPGEMESSEDCLRLNVHTTKLPSSNDTTKNPVLVFFHPSGYYKFFGQSLSFGSMYLAEQGVVVVTLTYRVGSLGYFSTGDSSAPGNLGLKDQVEALRWVQRNIAAFGGDPDKVTISGYSDSGWFVALHMVSPMSRGLFHRAIIMSGSTMVTRPLPTHQKHLAVEQAQLLGCPTDTTENMIQCLNTKPVKNITDTWENVLFPKYGSILAFLPVVEPEMEGVERFLTAQPADLIREGKFAQVPLITGITSNEVNSVYVLSIHENVDGIPPLKSMDEKWEDSAPTRFMYEAGTNRSRDISKALRKFYFGNKTINRETAEDLAKVYADDYIIYPVHQFTKLVASASKAPVYLYKFSYNGSYGFSEVLFDEKPTGVTHYDDLLYFFYINFTVSWYSKHNPENPIIDRQTKMWGTFARTGNPIPAGDAAFNGVTWEPYSVKEDNFLDMGSSLKMQKGLYPDRMQLWEKLLPLPPLQPH